MVQRWRMERVGVPRQHKTSIVPSNPAIIERFRCASTASETAQQWRQRSAQPPRCHDRNTRNASNIRHAWSRCVVASECDVAYAYRGRFNSVTGDEGGISEALPGAHPRSGHLLRREMSDTCTGVPMKAMAEADLGKGTKS